MKIHIYPQEMLAIMSVLYHIFRVDCLLVKDASPGLISTPGSSYVIQTVSGILSHSSSPHPFSSTFGSTLVVAKEKIHCSQGTSFKCTTPAGILPVCT